MATSNRRLHREATRHIVATVIAAAVAVAVIVVTAVITSTAPDLRSTTGGAMALAFGAYGPAFLWLSHLAFRGLKGDPLRARLRRSEEQRGWVRFLYLGGPKSWAMLIVFIGVVSVLLLASSGSATDLWLVVCCVLGVAGTWVLLVAVFAVEHMRGWAEHGGLRFPGEGERTFSDFVYLSIQLSTTFSSSDVALTNRPARSLASVQSVVGFAYSTVVIAVFASLLITLTV